jgi:hypothetical protein
LFTKSFLRLSAKAPSPVQWRREAFVVSFLSPKPSTRGKAPSPRGSSLSAKALFPVVAVAGRSWPREIDQAGREILPCTGGRGRSERLGEVGTREE